MAFEGKNDGRIGRLEEQTLGYYRRVRQTLLDGFDNQEDDKELFIKNVFDTLAKEALLISQNQTASTIVELLLMEANILQLTTFAEALSKDWELSCTDRFASHVTQTLVSQLGKHINEETSDAFQLFVQIYGFLMSNLAFYMQHTYTSHIVRVMLEVLGGVKVLESVIRSKVARQGRASEQKETTSPTSPDPRFKPLLKEMTKKLSSLNMMTDHIKNHLSNPVLQTLLLVLHKTSKKRCQKVCSSILDATNMFISDQGEESENSLPELVCHSTGSHFVEQVIHVASEELLDTILTTHLEEKLLTMAVHPTANFVLHKMIKSCQNSEQFECIFSSLRAHLESVLCKNHNQLITALAEGCVKHGTKQEKLIKALMKCFHCYSPEERQIKCVQLFATITAYEIFYKLPDDDEELEDMKLPELTKVNIHGSLLLQQLLQFGNPKVIVMSLLQMNGTELRNMSCDPCGSHVIESFVKSSSIGEKSNDILYRKLQSLYIQLACDKNGSRTLDTLFKSATVKNQFTIVEQLVKQEAKLRGDRFGRFCWNNYKAGLFLRNKNEWKQTQNSELKKRKIYEALMDSDKGKKRKLNEETADVEDRKLPLKDSKIEDDSKSQKRPKKKKKKQKTLD